MDNETYKKTNFIIAEILACISFILNTICVVTADRGGPFASVWITHFGIIYWSKTILAIIGIYYFFTSKVFTVREIPRYISICTLIILWYSIPFINTVLIIIVGTIFKAIQGSSTLEYEDRIPIQIIWSVPFFIIIRTLLMKIFKIIKK